MADKGILHTIDKALSQCVGDFDIATAAVDALTVMVATTKGKKTAMQGLTYISRPLDLIIQLIVSPIFILYQTGKDIYLSFKEKGFGWGVAAIAISPLNLVWKTGWQLLSTNFLSTPINCVLPISTLADFVTERRALVRIIEMKRFGLFKTIISENLELQNIRRKLKECHANIIEQNKDYPCFINKTSLFYHMLMWGEKVDIWNPKDVDPEPQVPPQPQAPIARQVIRIPYDIYRMLQTRQIIGFAASAA